MRIGLLSLTLLGVFSLPAAALADPFTIYALNGTLQKGGTLSGMFRVYQAGVLDADLTLLEQGVTYRFGSVRAAPVNPILDVYLEDVAVNKDPDLLTLDFPVTTLTGYLGGPLCSVTFACPPQTGNAVGEQSSVIIKFGYSDSPTFTSFSDTFTSLSASQVTPEPEALGVVGLALASVAGAMQRRLCGSGLPGR